MKRVCYYYVFLLSLFTLVPTYADELSVRDSIRNQARIALLREDFDQLEQLAFTYSKQDQRTPSGAQKINLFFDGLNLALLPPTNEPESYYFQMEKKVLRWIKAYPKSPIAHLTYVSALSAHATFFRGTGYANTVPKEAWEPFYRYVNLAMKYLEQNKTTAAADTAWYTAKISLATSLGWPQERIRPIFEEAVSKDVNDDRIFYTTLNYFLPKWQGDAGQLDQFITYVVSKTQKQRGMELYARLYAAASQMQYEHFLFSQSRASWPKMKQGFEDLLKRYPDQWNVNIFAHFSCLALDRTKTSELMKLIGEKPMLTVWEPNGSEVFNNCRNWIYSTDSGVGYKNSEQSVIFNGPEDFVVVPAATGKVSRSGPFLSVILDQFTMRANAKYKTPQKIVRYKIGLAFTVANGGWDIIRWSEPIAQDVVLAPGDTKQLENVAAIIPVDGLPLLKDYWLVLAVEIDNGGKGAYTYAHSDKGLF